MKAAMRLCLGGAMAVLAASAAAAPPRAVPVEIGGSQEWDACGSLGEVRGLKPGGDGFLAVRAGPGASYLLLDKLGNGRQVYVCRTRGRWVSVVYAAAGSNTAQAGCGVSSAIAQARVYRGPCRSGWVHSDWIEIVAG
ncbi:hypothetical protein [Pseudomonas sp. CGJS7]|uniref:hypothetical protein n=1 Tax=Pseudomonas sp. CGJS7 TaxID=3109348 RepID=UPI003009C098